MTEQLGNGCSNSYLRFISQLLCGSSSVLYPQNSSLLNHVFSPYEANMKKCQLNTLYTDHGTKIGARQAEGSHYTRRQRQGLI